MTAEPGRKSASPPLPQGIERSRVPARARFRHRDVDGISLHRVLAEGGPAGPALLHTTLDVSLLPGGAVLTGPTERRYVAVGAAKRMAGRAMLPPPLAERATLSHSGLHRPH